MNILITGGASGLGEAITKKLASNRENALYFTYCKSEGEAVLLEKEFANCSSLKCDFSNKTEVAALCDKISDFDIDVLINNAFSGDFLKTHFHKIILNEFETDFQKNIIPTIQITQTAINFFRKKKAGKIITVLSAALVGIPPVGSAVYVANKAYLAQLSRVWASENAKFGITSNTVSPAFMETKLTASFDERMLEQMKEAHPLKTLLKTGEVADTVYFLVNAPKQLNGVDIVINSALGF